jgi:tetratricopeptide (TPR) repeat protein
VAPIPETKVTVAQNWALMLADAGRISQAAGLLHTAAEDSLMGASLPPLQRAVLLDNLATSELTLGARDRAQALLDQARPIFDSLDNKLERAKHAMNRAGMAQLTGDTAAATAAFLEAHDLMLKHWRSDTDVDKYIVAFDVTLARSATTESDAIAEHLQGGLDLINTGRPTEAMRLMQNPAVNPFAGSLARLLRKFPTRLTNTRQRLLRPIERRFLSQTFHDGEAVAVRAYVRTGRRATRRT